MTVSAVGSFVNAAMSSGLGTRDFSPSYGLSFRFTVEVDGLSLGAWQSCSGLKVDFKPAEQKSGGTYVGGTWLPGEVAWTKITLKRAVSKDASQKVQQWLQEKAFGWVEGKPVEAGGAIVTLYDAQANPVMHWKLRGVRPAAWSGPDLEATQSRVAIEQLELVHEGFTVGTGAATGGPSAPAGTGSQYKVVLTEGENPSQGENSTTSLAFEHPPVEIELRKTQKPLGFTTAPAQNLEGETATGADASMTFNAISPNVATWGLKKLVIRGTNVAADIKKLRRWATKRLDAKGNERLKLLCLSWGPGFEPQAVYLTSLNVNITRFAPDGTPIKAVVGLDLEEKPTGWADASPSQTKTPAAKPASRPAPSAASGGGAPAATTPPPKPEPPKPAMQMGSHRGGSTGGAKLGAMNPTSGGTPGRSARVLQAGDSLAAIAQTTYADASLWREIAEVNGIDDPLDLPPGYALFLPAASEV